MNYPRLAAYSGIRSSGEPLIKTGRIDTAMCAAMARFGIVNVDMNAMLLHPEIRAGLKDANPNVRIVGYALITHWWLKPDFIPQPNDKSMNAAIHLMLQRTGGFLPKPVAGYEVDWAKKETADGYIAILSSAVASGLFDDVFFDYLAPEVAWAGVGDVETDKQRVSNMKRLVQVMHAVVGTDSKVYGNGTGAKKLSASGVMVEGYIGKLPTAMFTDAINQLPGDWLKSEGAFGTTGDPKLARLTLGTACLTGAFATHGTSHYTEAPYDCTWWFPEYSVAPNGAPDDTGAYIHWLGMPHGECVDLRTGLWMRTFDNGCVLVNPTKASLQHDMLFPAYRRIGLSAPLERTFTIGAEDALFLRR